jgi:drug/metabolite transporter (DMT)-like permease
LAFKLLPLGVGYVIIQANPFVVALLSGHFLNEKFSTNETIGMITTFIGIAILCLSGPS